MKARYRIALLAMLPAAPCAAADLPAQAPHQAPSPSAVGTIPAMTVVQLEIDEPLGSKTSKTGQAFAIRLRNPILVDGRETVPAGTLGRGEVVHAKKGGGSGAPGELVLAARYLDVGGRRLPLRSLRFGELGSDKIATVNAMAVASAVGPLPVAMLGFLITGGERTVEKGTAVTAKTAADFLADSGQAGAPSPHVAPILSPEAGK